jgi:hypothetical protein
MQVTKNLIGFIFNKLPLIRKLKLREVITFKGLMGKLSDQNRATAENGLLVGQIADGTRSTNPNYNGVNVYGDETSVSDIRPFLQGIGAQAPFLMPYINQLSANGAIPVSRTGYREVDVVDPNAVNVKIGGSLNYKIKNNLELVIAGNYGTGNTIYSGSDRYSIKDFKMGQYKAELNGKNWFLRAYTTQENAGQDFV